MTRLFAKLLCPTLLLAAFVGAVVAPSHAEAGVRIPLPISMGPYYYLVGVEELPSGAPDKQALIAWKCDHGLDVLWANVAMFGCHLIALKPSIPNRISMKDLDVIEDQYRIELPKEALREELYPFEIHANAKRSFWDKYGRWFLLLALIGVGVFYLRSSKTEAATDGSTPAGNKPSTDAPGSTAPQNA